MRHNLEKLLEEAGRTAKAIIRQRDALSAALNACIKDIRSEIRSLPGSRISGLRAIADRAEIASKKALER
jgi:hypothetical protein